MKNRVGVLNRLTGLLTRRNINIESAVITSISNNQLAIAEFKLQVADPQEREHLKRVIAKQLDVLSVEWRAKHSDTKLVSDIEKD